MQTNKDKEKRINAKLQLINIVSSINLLSFLINSLNNIYRDYSRSLIRFLCVSVYLQNEKGYFYKKDLFTALPYQHSYFISLFKKYESYFKVIYSNGSGSKLILSDLGSTTLQEFYSIFIEQLSESVN